MALIDFDEDHIRLLIWDKGFDPILTPEEIQMIIELAGGVLERAAALGWAIKGGYYAQMIDIEESGSIRRLSQLYAQAERMHRIWDAKAATIELTLNLNYNRVPPKGFSILGEKPEGELVSMFRPNEPVNIRMFPLYRMPAIL